jgi:hypothetical protein
MRQKYMIDGMAPTGAAWGVATTGILGWIARISAIVVGVAFLLVTFVVSIPALLLAAPAHFLRRRLKRPLTWIGSLFTMVVATSIVVGVVFGYALLGHNDKTGTSAWHEMIASMNQPKPNPPPPPQWLRYIPGAAAGYRPAFSPGFGATVMVLAFAIMAEIIGAMFGSLIWGAAWLVVSGWTGRPAGVPRLVDD